LVVGTSGRKEGERRGEGAVEYDQSMFEWKFNNEIH
jgi:hypothetical protein